MRCIVSGLSQPPKAAAAGKFQRVYFAGRIKNGEFKVVVKRRGRDGLPIHSELSNAALV